MAARSRNSSEAVSRNPTSQAFWRRKTPDIARRLIGSLLRVRDSKGVVSVRIVETEAYLSQGDPASHSYRGQTKRNAAMFGPPGHAYVYFCYGAHTMLNFTTGPGGIGEAVLIRAAEPVTGLARIARRRGLSAADRREGGFPRRLMGGPGRVTRALGVRLSDNHATLGRGRFSLRTASRNARIVRTTRVGLTRGAAMRLRFYDADSPAVSRR